MGILTWFKSLFSSSSKSKWEFRAVDICRGRKYRNLDCKQRTMILAREMSQAEEEFDIWYGEKKHRVLGIEGILHVWIEHEGAILDPAQQDNRRQLYTKIQKLSIEELDSILKRYNKVV